MKVKKESENVGLKLNIQKAKIMASSPITSWYSYPVEDFILGVSKITADGDCSHEIKDAYSLGGKCRRIDAFELWCWRRLLRVPWTARRSTQFILKEISPKYLLEGLRLKVKLQYFGHLMRRTDSLEMALMLGNFEGRSRSV